MKSPRKRRLAVIDTVFPWKQSGFRYWECCEIFHQRPDTLFFAVNVQREGFPTTVHRFEEFKEMAKENGITDVYCVFLNLACSLLGCRTLPSGMNLPGSNPHLDISTFLREKSIRLHTTLYPGGGMGPDTPAPFLSLVREGCTSIFTNVQEVLDEIPSSIFTPVVIQTDHYSYKKKSLNGKIQLTFAANRGVRKGFSLLANVFNQLDDTFHLNIIGDWERDLHLLKNRQFTYYGPLPPEDLTSVYQQTHVFLYTGTQDQFALDGFPVTAAADAMSTGCLLISTNPRNDRLTLVAGKDYLEVEAMSYAFVNELNWVKDNTAAAMKIGETGAMTIKKLFDCKGIVKQKIHHIFQS